MDLIPGYASSFLHSLLWAASCIGIGWPVSSRVKTFSGVGRLVLSFLAGSVAWVMICLLLALFHLLRAEIVRILVYLAGFVSLILLSKAWWKSLKSVRLLDWRNVCLVIVIAAQGLFALMPVTAFDATTYHLPLAGLMLEKGTITWTPFIFNSSFPQSFEVLEAIGLAIGGDVSATLVSWLFSIAAILTLIEIGNCIGKPAAGLWAALAAGITPLWFEQSSILNNEIGMAFGLFVISLAIAGRMPGWIIGLAIGWLAGCKYYGIEIGVVALLIWIFQNKPGRRSLLSAIALAVLIAGFWYLRNLYLFSNPIFPYFGRVFSFLGPPRAAMATQGQWDVYSQFDEFASPTTLLGWLTVPVKLLLHPAPDFIPDSESAWKWTVWLALLWPLSILPLARKRSALVGVFLLTLLLVANWTLVHKIIYLRFLTPLLPLMFLLSFSAFSDWLPDLKVPRSHLRWIEPALAILVIAHLVGPTTPATLNLLPLTSRERDVFLESNIPAWLVIRELNEMDPPPVVYFLYGENARHYCRFPLYSGWRDPYGFMVFREHASSGSELGAWLEEIGVDILIVNGRRQWGIPDDIGKALSSDEFIRLYRPDIVDYRLTSVFVKSDLGYRLQVQKRKDSGPTQ